LRQRKKKEFRALASIHLEAAIKKVKMGRGRGFQ